LAASTACAAWARARARVVDVLPGNGNLVVLIAMPRSPRGSMRVEDGYPPGDLVRVDRWSAADLDYLRGCDSPGVFTDPLGVMAFMAGRHVKTS
jgi:hypothetical protein